MSLKLAKWKFEILKWVDKYDLVELFKSLWESWWEDEYNKFLKIKKNKKEAFMYSLSAFLKVKSEYKEKVSLILNPRWLSDLDLRLWILSWQRYNQFANEVAVVLRLSSENIDNIINTFSKQEAIIETEDILFTQEWLKQFWDLELRELFEKELQCVRFWNFVAMYYCFLIALEKSWKQQLLEFFKTTQRNKLLFLKIMRRFWFKWKSGNDISIRDLLVSLESIDYYNKWVTYVKRENTRKNNITIRWEIPEIYTQNWKSLRWNN